MKKINVWFICVNCGKEILPADKTCRDHCPHCFVWLHVDGDMPWDRVSDCGSKMYPTEYKIANGWIKILFKCSLCWKLHWNKASGDDEVVSLDSLIYEYKRNF